MFFLAVCERAAVDNQQIYLSEQLVKSVSGCRESGVIQRSTLRTLLLSGILPAYVEASYSSDCGWIFVVPILEATTRILNDILLSVNLNNDGSRKAVTTMVGDVATSLCIAFAIIADEPHRLRKPCFLVTLSVAFGTIETLASVIDYVHRFSYSATTAVQSIVCLQSFGRKILARLEQVENDVDMDSDDEALILLRTAAYSSTFENVRTFSRQELNRSLAKNWIKQGEEYFVLRGNSRRQVNLEIGDRAEESEGAIKAIRKCLKAMENLLSFGDPRKWERMQVRFRDPQLVV